MISVLNMRRDRRWEKRTSQRIPDGESVMPSLACFLSLTQKQPWEKLPGNQAISPIFIWKLLKECSLICFICSMSRMA